MQGCLGLFDPNHQRPAFRICAVLKQRDKNSEGA
jgi:hypothetical protein